MRKVVQGLHRMSTTAVLFFVITNLTSEIDSWGSIPGDDLNGQDVWGGMWKEAQLRLCLLPHERSPIDSVRL